MSGTSGRGAHAPPRSNGRRVAVILGAALSLLIAFGGGYLLAQGGNEGDAAISATPSRTSAPSPSQDESPDPSPSGTASPSQSAAPPILEDGRHFVFLNAAKESGPRSLTFDLAEFYTDEEAVQVAQDRGDEAVNGYYIVNDNPRLRTMPVAASVVVRYIPDGSCCALQQGTSPRSPRP